MRVAVTGAAGRLGSALIAALRASGPDEGLPWDRSAFDLDHPGSAESLLSTHHPDVVIHTAAWTDVDGCARDPELAMARNAEATGVLARACSSAGTSMVLISTNEVFSGNRSDGRGWMPSDDAAPANPYGASKLAGEVAAAAAYRDGEASLAVVRTAWLFGPGKPDFPAKIASAARRAGEEGRSVRVVSDEIGSPTYIPDLAAALVSLTRSRFDGIHHVVNAGMASRAEWARDVLDRLGIAVEIEEISLDDYERPSRPPRWGVLARTPSGEGLRPWQSAMGDRAEQLLETQA